MIGGLKKWKKNENLEWTLPDHTVIEASYRNQSEFGVEVEFNWNGELTFAEVIEQLGDIPIPPYLLRKAEASDSIRYQTTYASISGSVAAPTAGLHFTEKVFESLKLKKIESLFLTLHVGAGTFKPVKANLAHEHEMHAEWVEIKKTLLQQLMQFENTIAVGTTSLRTLESIYWYAFLAVQKNSLFEEDYILPQFVAYTNVSNFSRKEILKSLLHLMDIEKKESIFFKTQIMIMPSYKIRMVDYLVTNFHQPNSTLLMLISAVTKNKWKPIYEFALANNYRFLSYGDGCLIKIETTE
jgi:S-adenosylmethionine:tRNA ribosyltransferase-isomerase